MRMQRSLGAALFETGKTLEERARDLDPERDVFGQDPFVRGVDVALREREAAQDGRDALVGERRDDRERPAGANQQRPASERALEGAERELDCGLLRPDEARRIGR